jgi:hypothetical protein
MKGLKLSRLVTAAKTTASEDDNTSSSEESAGPYPIQRGDYNRGLRIHESYPPQLRRTRNCPPRRGLTFVPGEPCNCRNFNIDLCLQINNFQVITDNLRPDRELSFEEEMQWAIIAVDNVVEENHVQRKRLCRTCFRILRNEGYFGQWTWEDSQNKERRRLPKCIEAKIRQIFPEYSGLYMWFKES